MSNLALKNNNNRKKGAVALVFAALFSLLAYQFPSTGDDWAWATSEGMERLQNGFFEGYNGRYLGNLLVMALVRSKTLDVVVTTLGVLLLCWLLSKLTVSRKPEMFALASFFIFLTPKQIFAQSIVWTSGFSNYATSTMLYLAFLVFYVSSYRSEEKLDKYWIPIMLLLGFGSAFFVENVTLFILFVAFAAVVLSFKRCKKLLLPSVAYGVGDFAGAVLVVKNSAYRVIAEGNDENNREVFTSVKPIIMNTFKQIFFTLRLMVVGNVGLLTVLTITTIVLFFIARKSIKKGERTISSICLATNTVALIAMYFVAPRINKAYESSEERTMVIVLTGVLSAVYLITIVVSLFVLLNKKDLIRIFLPIIPAIVILLPFCFTEIYGARCMFTSYAMTVLTTMLLVEYVIEKCFDESTKEKVKQGIWVAMVISFVVLLIVYIPIGSFDRSRTAYINQKVSEGADNISVSTFENRAGVWDANPTFKIWIRSFGEVYGIDYEKTTVTLIDREDFQKLLDAEK